MSHISKISILETKQLLHDHKQGMGPTLLSHKYKYSETSIKNWLHARDAYVYKKPNAFVKKYECNDNFFEKINTEEKAYWLGFILADGCVTNNRLAINLSKKDHNHLIKFKQDIKSNGKIIMLNKKSEGIIAKHGKKKFYEQCYLGIYSPKISSDLFKLGITENKTFTCNLPKIDNEMQSHLLRGLFDGDGWISFRSADGQPEIGVMGNKSILNSVKQIFNRNCSVNNLKIRPIKNMFRLRYSGKNKCSSIAKYLYQNANIFLDRKFKSAQKLF